MVIFLNLEFLKVLTVQLYMPEKYNSKVCPCYAICSDFQHYVPQRKIVNFYNYKNYKKLP